MILSHGQQDTGNKLAPFIIFPEFPEFCEFNERSPPLRKTFIIIQFQTRKQLREQKKCCHGKLRKTLPVLCITTEFFAEIYGTLCKQNIVLPSWSVNVDTSQMNLRETY